MKTLKKLLFVTLIITIIALISAAPAFAAPDDQDATPAPAVALNAAPANNDVAPAGTDPGQGYAIVAAAPDVPDTTKPQGLSIELIFILGFLVESFVEYGKLIFVDKTINWKQVAAMILGVGLAFLLNVDVFKLVGLKLTVPYAGVALTGILASRGSNWLADFVKWLQGLRGGGIASGANL